MNDRAAIVFFHKGKIPRYLRCALESARYFNPQNRIFLIGDQIHRFEAWHIESRTAGQLHHRLLPTFLDSYIHISGIKFYYERLFLERWFHVEELIQQENLSRVLYLDSDSLLFSPADELFALMPPVNVSTSKSGGPACTFIQRSLEPFLQFILDKYQDKSFIETWQKRSDAARARGGLENLGDMVFLATFIEETGQGSVYANDQDGGHIDHCVNIPDGMEYRDIPHRKRQRKRIFWKDDGRTFRPFFHRQVSGEPVQALSIHFQSGAKRKVRRFNRVPAGSLAPRWLRRAYFNWLTA